MTNNEITKLCDNIGDELDQWVLEFNETNDTRIVYGFGNTKDNTFSGKIRTDETPNMKDGLVSVKFECTMENYKEVLKKTFDKFLKILNSLSYCVVCTHLVLKSQVFTDLQFNDVICKKCEHTKEAQEELGL